MPPLENGLRGDLEGVVKKARVIAERGARSAIESLTVHEARSGSHLDKEGQRLRARLRAHAKQLGDNRTAKGEQEITRLVRECAYEHWHRMLFARFLAENELLIHPEHNVSVSLDDVEELAREAGLDKWELASRFAQGMLPQIFRVDDPVLAVALPRERTLELEQLLESLPGETFRADDSLGWVYQFWRSEEQDRVDASGEKITGDTLPAVTQLFTEHYMVLFLLHNTLGAWHAGKVLAARPDLAINAKSEQELRAAVRLTVQGGYDFEYLRFVRAQQEGDKDGEPTGRWRPAAGAFEGWPREAKDLKVLDPCCGSGHFLVGAFDFLVLVRMTEEHLSLEDAIRAVLAENLVGLELDPRCTQIAAFNLAFRAWRRVGGPITLPPLRIACSGLGPNATEEEWISLVEASGIRIPALGREPIRRGMLNIYDTFSIAPTLGSLLDPNQAANAEGFAADYETLRPYLAAALSAESTDEETHERAVAAAGIALASELLADEYTLVVTNVPYLGRGKQDDLMKHHLERHYEIAKADLATALVLRCCELCADGGTTAVVTPQNWLFLNSYNEFRGQLLRNTSINLIARLGSNAFRGMNWWAAITMLICLTRNEPDPATVFTGIDVGDHKDQGEKANLLAHRVPQIVHQLPQMKNAGNAITFNDVGGSRLLCELVKSVEGLSTGDGDRFLRKHWELSRIDGDWDYFHVTPDETREFDGLSEVVWWEQGRGELSRSTSARIQGQAAWGKSGVLVSKMNRLKCCRYFGVKHDKMAAALVPTSSEHLPALWALCSSPEYHELIREVSQKVDVATATLVQIPFDIEKWSQMATKGYPDGLPEPASNDPTQWLFHGRPDEAQEGTELQVAVARLLGYRWPAELDDKIRLSKGARTLIEKCGALAQFADDDGIVCIPPVRGERSAADRLAALMAACGVKANRDLNAWLRDNFFQEHCGLFHHRPFIWHIWDGRKDGFSVLVNYHKLAAPGGAGRRLLTALTHAYLGDWLKDQKDQVNDGKAGAEARLAAALDLKVELEKILAGEPPYDIFVRWKPLREQSIGWEPDINDGVRLNIRPLLVAKDVGRKGAGILRFKPNVKWDKDRGKEPNRPKTDYPWFWSCDPEKHAAHRTDFPGGTDFDGNRWNDLHYTNAFKQAARDEARKVR